MATIVSKPTQKTINYWWLAVAFGIVLIVFGIWVIRSPFESYLSVSWAFALGMFGLGMFDCSTAIIHRRTLHSWGWQFITGIADLLLGIYLFIYPIMSIIILPVVIGLWIIFSMLMAVGNALHIRSYGFSSWRRLLFTAITIVLLGLFILALPSIGIENLIFWSGIAFILTGLLRIYFSLKLRHLK